MNSVCVNEHIVVVWRNPPVLVVVVFLRVVLLVIGEETVELDALFEVLRCLEAFDILEEFKVAVGVDASSDESMPVDTLQLNVGVVLLEVEIGGEADVGALDGVHVLACHLKLVKVKVLREYLHYFTNLLLLLITLIKLLSKSFSSIKSLN